MIRRRDDGASGDTPGERDDWTLEVESPRQDPPAADRWDDPESRAEQERWRANHPLEDGASYGPIAGTSARPKPSKGAKVVQAGATVGHGLTKGAKAVAHGTNVVSHSAYRVTRKATHAGGAGETGLSRLIEVHGLHNAGDAVVAISLAGSLFFSVPTGEARGQVLLFLLLTLLPFSIIAPFVGPFLDRFRHGRRWAIGSMMAVRAVLCLVLAGSLENAAWWQFPAALGILVASKAYNVTRSAATPRLLPEGMTLVKANGRMSMAGVVGAAIAGPVAVGIAYFGSGWSLRFAFVIFALGTVLAILLPPAVDSTKGESEVSMSEVAGRTSRWVPPAVVNALRANVGLRMLSGFLTIFLAFLLRESPPEGWGGSFTLLIGLVAAAAGIGSAIGTVLGSLTRLMPPRALVRLALIIDVVAAVATAINFGMVTVLILTAVVGMCQQLGKLALDAVIQESVPEHSRTSVFGRSETLIQLAWVIGGGLAVVLPADATIGMGVIAVVLVAWLLVVLLPHRGRKADLPTTVEPRSD
ncbi:MFS transporter [Ornithinimicrobium faecis]|uniref:MFS transporter n=1 Tax=Ornithinimicrobium faecis TaxID=2934158 RepID=UPI002118F019|nr:MFS transporter [Ornithinimicrobium sp. HY1745]